MQSSKVFLVVISLNIFALRPADAQVTDSGRAAMTASVTAAKQTLEAGRLPKIAQAEAGVKQAAAAVENYFLPITSTANKEKWIQYVATEPLIQAIDAGESDTKILELAHHCHSRLIANQDGLELAPLRQLRDRVDELMVAVRYKDADKSIKLLDQQLTSFNERIGKLAGIPSAEEAASIAAIAKLIDESNQGTTVLPTIRQLFSRPNVVISVGSALVQQAASQVVQRSRAINDCILGTRVVGNGTLSGLVTAHTMPSFGQARVELILSARFNSQSTGYNGPVRLKTLGDGEVRSSRTVFISEAGVSLSPTATSATLSSKITSIIHPLKIVRKIATKRAAEQKPKADAIARERLRNQVGSEFENQVAQAVANHSTSKRDSAMAKARTTLMRLNLSEPSRMVGSNEHAIFLEATQAAPNQLAAINSAPPLMPGSFDLAIQLHESTVDNVAARILAGRTMSGKQLDRLMALATNAESAVAGDAVDEENFSIDFAKLRPIIFEARDQTVRVGIRGTRFKQGERELARPLEITATYRPVILQDGSSYLERTGDVGVDFPGARRLTISQVALKRSIQNLFGDRFPPTLLEQTLLLPATLPIDSLKNKPLRAQSIDSQDGWLSITAK